MEKPNTNDKNAFLHWLSKKKKYLNGFKIKPYKAGLNYFLRQNRKFWKSKFTEQ